MKPESIFILTTSRAVLGDFSLACALGDSERMAQRVPVVNLAEVAPDCVLETSYALRGWEMRGFGWL